MSAIFGWSGTMKRLGLWLVLLAFNGCGLLLVTSAVNSYSTALSSQGWPTARGKVHSSQVVEYEPEVTHRGRGERGTTLAYYPEVKYEYTVDGILFQGDRLSAADETSNIRKWAERIAAQYVSGQEVVVHYNPDDPGEALLRPGEGGGALSTLVMGVLFMLIPTGMVLYIGGSDLVPPLLRLWWSMKFGKLRHVDEGTHDRVVEPHWNEQATSPQEAQPTSAPAAEGFRERIVDWRPGRRVELRLDPPGIGGLILVCGTLGLLVGVVGTVVVAKTVLDDRSPSEYMAIAGGLSLIGGLLVAAIILFKDRGRQIVLDWDTLTLDARRKFAYSFNHSLRDIERVIVRCEPVKSKHRRYRATVELDVTGEPLIAARTAQVRRKPEASRQEAMGLAEPLATALGVPVELAEWDDMDRS